MKGTAFSGTAGVVIREVSLGGPVEAIRDTVMIVTEVAQKKVPPAGFEPAAFRSGGERSIP